MQGPGVAAMTTDQNKGDWHQKKEEKTLFKKNGSFKAYNIFSTQFYESAENLIQHQGSPPHQINYLKRNKFF